MPGRQLDLAFDASRTSAADGGSGPIPHIRDEIARAWGLPLGERVEIIFRPAFPVPAVTGRLELLSTPDVPWAPRQPLHLRVDHVTFSSRDIERWTTQ